MLSTALFIFCSMCSASFSMFCCMGSEAENRRQGRVKTTGLTENRPDCGAAPPSRDARLLVSDPMLILRL